MPLPRPVFFAALLALILAGLPARASAQPQEVYPVRSGPSSRLLNGQWEFNYRPGVAAGNGAAPNEANLGATIAVPGHWELQGFAGPVYGTQELPAGTGQYRRTFRVPASWNGQRVFLHFDGVLYGFDAWVNGTKVGSWASAYNPVAFDVTDVLKADADNVLTVQVTTRSHGWEFDTNDCWALSGIYRDVTLFAVPAAHFTDYTSRTQLKPDGSATLTVNTFTTASGISFAEASGRLIGPDGKLAADLHFSNDNPTVCSATVTLAHPQLWTAETPSLYTLELALTSGQKITEKIGLREVTIVDGVLQLNGRPIKLRGVDHHDLWPEQGRVATEDLMRRDLDLIKAANCNFVRTSHYPPHPRFLELCDELGVYVMDEVPFGFGEKHLADPAYAGDLLTRARATVRRDHNRPSVIVWSVGNENPNTSLTIATARRVKELDPTRPVCFPQIGSYFAKSYGELPPEIDLYAPHYPSTATVREYATKLTRPVIFTEYAHALGLATDQVQAQWAIMQASPRLAGGCIWMFQDQGILRAAAPGQTPDTTHNLGLAVWPDARHYYDTDGNHGMDGIVYSDRRPQVDFWQVRKVYSPVQITGPAAPVRPGANEVTLAVENRFDFRSLDGVTLTWALLRNGAPTQNGAILLRAAAHGTETVTVPFTLPADAGTDVFALDLRCAERKTDSFYERTLRLDPLPAGVTRAALLVARKPDATLKLEEAVEEIRVRHPEFTLILTRATGEISLRDPAGSVLAGGFFPHIGRRFTEGEFVRAKKERTWTGAYLRDSTGLEVAAARTAEGITLKVRGIYARPDATEQSLSGELNLLVKPTGVIEVAYDYAPVNGTGLLLEAGLSLIVPATAPEFRWLGAGPYAGYPGKDMLNEFGLWHLNRADLNFQGNRRQVELALLTSAAGAGVALGGTDMDVAVERVGENTVLSHNAVLSGRGTKFVGPDTAFKAETAPRIAGKFTLLPLAANWPAPLAAWFGAPGAAQPFQPYYHSYDQ